ncbi:MAG TPA: NADP-dependent isocitrate dehydrogenase [Propionibacteriaceae bacterium]|nr:NADP-dependent isocitrate dehydrogenase [Propionibacteriaceae bacterium]
MKIVWTLTDESPRLASLTLLPLVRAFAALADVVVEALDISLPARIVAQFPERFAAAQRRPDPVVGAVAMSALGIAIGSWLVVLVVPFVVVSVVGWTFEYYRGNFAR